MLEPGGPSPGHLGGWSEFPRLDSVCGQGAHSTGDPCLLRVPKFLWSHLGPSLDHFDGQHALDRGELVAGEVDEELLGATPGGQDLKIHLGLLPGAQVWHADGERQESA